MAGLCKTAPGRRGYNFHLNALQVDKSQEPILPRRPSWWVELFRRRASPLNFPSIRKEITLMFTRFVECQVKPDQKDDFTDKLRNDVLPILQKQPGFVDLISLVSDNDPERIISVSFWNNKQDAERYHREHFKHISEMLKP